MFSATKFAAIGAIVFLVGGFMLIAEPFEQQRGSVPGAAQSDESEAVWVTLVEQECTIAEDNAHTSGGDAAEPVKSGETPRSENY